MIPRLKRQITAVRSTKSGGPSSSGMHRPGSEALINYHNTEKSIEQNRTNSQASRPPSQTPEGSPRAEAAPPPEPPAAWVREAVEHGRAPSGGGQGSGLLDMIEGADISDGLEFLTAWGSRPEAIRKELMTLTLLQVQQVMVWLCQRIRQPREDKIGQWTKAWKAMCEKLREALVSSPDTADRNQAYVAVVDSCFHCEFVAVLKMMPNTLGWPIIKVLRTVGRETLSVDILAQFLTEPSEGFFFLWYCTLWEEKKASVQRVQWRKTHAIPSAADVASELLRLHEDVNADQTVCRLYSVLPMKSHATDCSSFHQRSHTRRLTPSSHLSKSFNVGTRSGLFSPTRAGSGFFSPAANGDVSRGLRRSYTHASADSPRNIEDPELGKNEDDEVMSVGLRHNGETSSSVLEALASNCVLRPRRRASMKRMQMMLSIVIGSNDSCIERLIAAPRLFLAFHQEEQALQFLIAMLLDLDTKQMMSHFDRLQEQLQRFIRYHTNPLFCCLKLTAAVSKLCKRSSLAQDIWHGEHARLKRAAVQIFELLPQDAFDKIFENTRQRQTFMKLAFHEAAECLEMMDAPRFQDYLRTRWNGAMPWFEDVQTPEDYKTFCRSWLDPNTLIFSPKLRTWFHAATFVLFTICLQLLPDGFFLSCRLELDLTQGLLWTTVFGHLLQVATGQGRSVELFLVLCYVVLLAQCAAPSLAPLVGVEGDMRMNDDVVEMVWGVAVCVMTLRWLKYFSCFPRFGEQLSTITNMLQEMFSFLVVFFLFLLAFAMLFSRLRPQDDEYRNLPTAVVTMFRGSLIDFDLEKMMEQARQNSLIWGEVAAFLMFLLIAAVLLLNFLISIMNSVYESVRARGNTESAKAFLETISDGENHMYWEMNALPPPFNTVYAALLPFHFALSFVRALCFSPSDRTRRAQYFRFLREHEAPPVLMSLLVFPATLPLVAAATFPGFVVLLFLGPLVPVMPWLLEFEDLQLGWDFARYHMLIPSIWFAERYWNLVGEYVEEELRPCTRRLLMPFLCLGTGAAAVVICLLAMPFYWVWEAGISKWLSASREHQLQRRAKAGGVLPYQHQQSFELDSSGKELAKRGSLWSMDAIEEPKSCRRRSTLFWDDGAADSAALLPATSMGDTERPLADDHVRQRVLELLNSGKVLVVKGEPAFAEIMDDEDAPVSSPMQLRDSASPRQGPSARTLVSGSPAAEVPRLRPLKQECHAHFTRQIQGTPVLDLGMLWCFERQEPSRVPDILAKQLDRVFINLHSHEERVEQMLRELRQLMSSPVDSAL